MNITMTFTGAVTAVSAQGTSVPGSVQIGDTVSGSFSYVPSEAIVEQQFNTNTGSYGLYSFPVGGETTGVSYTINGQTWSSGTDTVVSLRENEEFSGWPNLRDIFYIGRANGGDTADVFPAFPGLISASEDHGLAFSIIEENTWWPNPNAATTPNLINSNSLPFNSSDFDIEGSIRASGEIFTASGMLGFSDQEYRISFEIDTATLLFNANANNAPIASGNNTFATIGSTIPLTDLFTWSDPDGAADVVNFVVQDRTDGSGYLTFNGLAQPSNTVFERPIGELSKWAFHVGAGVDQIGFNVIDKAGAFNLSAVANIAPTSAAEIPSENLLEYFAKEVAYNTSFHLGDTVLGGYKIAKIFIKGEFLAVGLVSADGTADKEPVLAIRGTTDALDWLENADPNGVGYSEFFTAWNDPQLGIGQWLLANPGTNITGHSQGGAQAQWLANEATAFGIDLGSILTFNSPGISQLAVDEFNERMLDPLMAHVRSVKHVVSAGDIVTLAGEAFLHGEVFRYNFDTWTSGSDSPIISFITDAHTNHWSKPEIYGSEFDVGQRTPLENYKILAEGFTVGQLGSDSFTHLFSDGKVDSEYNIFLTAIRETPGLMGFLPAFSTRQGAEDFRSEFPEIISAIARLYIGSPTVVVVDTSGFATAQTTANAILVGDDAANFLVGNSGNDQYLGGSGTDVNVLWGLVPASLSLRTSRALEFGEILAQGSDTIIGTAAELDGDTIYGFATDDAIFVAGAQFTAADMTVIKGSAILSVDTDQNGAIDFVITLKGEYDISAFVLEARSTGTIIKYTGYLGPVLVDDSGVGFGTGEGAAFDTGNVFANDKAFDGGGVQLVSFDASGLLGHLTYNDDGTFNYDPTGAFDQLGRGEVATEVFSYIATDATGLKSEADVTITLTGSGNAAPVAVDDAASTRYGMSSAAIAVLFNDTDDDDDILTLSDIGTAAHGQVADNGDGTVTYTPNAGFFGSDSFVYTVSDGYGGTDTGLVKVEIGAPAPAYSMIYGTSRSNNLRGTKGDDAIFSLGGKNDRMTGGRGDDVFVFQDEINNGIHEHDRIKDFKPGSDSILLLDDNYSITFHRKYAVITVGDDADEIRIDGRHLTEAKLDIHIGSFDDLFA